MKIIVQLLFIVLFCTFSFGQEIIPTNEEIVDEEYREDQFYASLTYNLLRNKPKDLVQSGFSTGFSFGFIRDMPINKQRNLAIGLGFGFAANSYNQNLIISQSGDKYNYNLIDDSAENVTKNKFITYFLEVPLEVRWRTSTTVDYDFWRIYTGIKFGYLVHNKTKFRADTGNEDLVNVADITKLEYGLTLSVGYGTWNFHLFYRLNNLFDKNAILNTQPIEMSELKIGLMFYIL